MYPRRMGRSVSRFRTLPGADGVASFLSSKVYQRRMGPASFLPTKMYQRRMGSATFLVFKSVGPLGHQLGDVQKGDKFELGMG